MLSTDDTPDRPTNGSHSLRVVLHRNLALDRARQEIVEEEKATERGLSVQSLGAFPKHINTIQSQLLRRGVVHLPVSLQTRIIAGA